MRRGLWAALLAGVPRDAKLVTVIDGHPATLSWLGAVHGHRVTPLGVSEFGQTGDLIDLYRHYGIDADAITYTDNATLIELFDAPKVGLWATLSEECVVPKGSDEGFTEKLHQAQKGSKVMLLRVKGRSRDPRSHAPHSPYPHR